MYMTRRRKSAIKYSIMFVVGAVLYSEYLCFVIQSWLWQDLTCLSENCSKILFIADPQVHVGDSMNWPWYIPFNWESERFLKKTFSRVICHFRPDFLVYLGYLMDEESILVLEGFYATTLSSLAEEDIYIKPNMYFRAHDRESMYMTYTENKEHIVHQVLFYKNEILTVRFNVEDQYKIYVPTCSYKMGLSNAGYGALIIDYNNEQWRYTVFWLPRKFPFTVAYLLFGPFLTVFGLVCCALMIYKIYYINCNKANMLRLYRFLENL